MSVFRIALCGAIVVLGLGAGSKPARAAGFGGPGVCGTLCMASYRTSFGPFIDNPMFPMTPNAYASYQTGQWGNPMMQDPRMAMAIALNWNGSQPLGLSYSPPIGSAAIYNDWAAAAYGF